MTGIKTLSMELDSEAASKSKSYHTLDLKPRPGEMIKPSETINIVGIDHLTLADKRSWNMLLHNAFGPDLREEERDFRINLSELRSNHNGNERVEDTIERLMKTIVRCRKSDGSVTRFALLGGNNMGDPNRPRGELVYSFDKRLTEALKDSARFGKLEILVMAAFGSKYALAFYEHMSQLVNLKHVWTKDYELDEFRDLLGVGKNQYKAFGNFKQRVLLPAMKEYNMWASHTITIAYKKTGQRVTGIVLSWVPKSGAERNRIQEELQKSKVGRKARMSDVTETLIILQSDNDDLENSEKLAKL